MVMLNGYVSSPEANHVYSAEGSPPPLYINEIPWGKASKTETCKKKLRGHPQIY